MAEERPFAACEHRSHQLPMAGEDGVAHGIDAPVDPMQPAGPHPPRDRALAQPKVHELSTGHRSVLAHGQLGNPVIDRGCGGFSMYASENAPHPLPARG